MKTKYSECKNVINIEKKWPHQQLLWIVCVCVCILRACAYMFMSLLILWFCYVLCSADIYRLDWQTSGVMMLGKTKEKAMILEHQIQNGFVTKEYVCRVQGEFPLWVLLLNKHGNLEFFYLGSWIWKSPAMNNRHYICRVVRTMNRIYLSFTLSYTCSM